MKESSSPLTLDEDILALRELGQETKIVTEEHEGPSLGRFALPKFQPFNQQGILALPSSLSGRDAR
jgi:hypothetical protein